MDLPKAPIPMETAGFIDPPEMAPIAKPPTVTQEPIAKPKKFADFVFGFTATQRTTSTSTNVNSTSAKQACQSKYCLPGANGNVSWQMMWYVSAAARPPM